MRRCTKLFFTELCIIVVASSCCSGSVLKGLKKNFTSGSFTQEGEQYQSENTCCQESILI